jgi:PAS domain S-box-containing protein
MTYILVVEDETDLREVFVEAIRDEGFQVIESVTADLAMEWLASEDVRLIVTDINLPGRLNGIELALAARERHPDIPLIFVSGKPEMLERARELCSAASYLEKPFRLEVLLDQVRCCMKEQVPIQISNKSTPDNEDRLLVQSVTDCAIFKIDPQGLVANWNSGAERIKGYTADEVLGVHFAKFFTAEDQARDWPQRSLQAAREAGRFEDEGWRVRKDGTRFRASVVIHAIRAESGVLKGFGEVTRDISEKHAARQALEASEGRLRLLLDNVVHRAIYSLDLEGHITSWNPDAELAKGYTNDEILCRHFSIFYTPEDQAKASPRRHCAWRGRPDGSRRKAGGSARTGRAFGPVLCLIRCVTQRGSWSASPKSRTTSATNG